MLKEVVIFLFLFCFGFFFLFFVFSFGVVGGRLFFFSDVNCLTT